MINPRSKTVIDTGTQTKPEFIWHTVLFNCYCHMFDEVVEQLIKAINCTSTTGSQLARVAEQFGSVSVYTGSEAQCEKVADILGSTGLDVKVSQ